jgi:hypothetical protein
MMLQSRNTQVKQLDFELEHEEIDQAIPVSCFS